ncbi:tRNA-specific adenosine deaminase [Histoplasma ohiense]|nr:tRNA-specific adenosine deaminase [Histoplasma ohiense (nom. inval.)]
MKQCRGMVLHDSHAEILAIRAFNHWLLEECKSLLQQRVGSSNYEFECGSIGANEASGNYGAEPYPVHEGMSDKQASVFINWRHRPETQETQETPAPYNLSRTSDINHLAKTKLSWTPFELRKDLKIYMYGTCAPCGDASMELCMASQEDPTPWTMPHLKADNDLEISNSNDSDTNGANNTSHRATKLLNGRAHFSILGAVRRKPSRADAESTLSKSCSDKLAVKQVTSLLTFPACLLIAPSPNAYLTALLLPEEEISRVACARAFGSGETGRLRALNGRIWSDDDGTTAFLGGRVNYAFHPFDVRPVPTVQFPEEWAFGKPNRNDGKMRKKSKSGNISAVWTAAPSSTSVNGGCGKAKSTTNLNETLVNGVKQGYHISSPSPRKASALSRAKMWSLLRDIAQLLPSADEYCENNTSTIQEDKLEEHMSTERALDNTQDNALLAKLKDYVLIGQNYYLMKRGCVEMGLGPVKVRKEVISDVREVLGNWVENRGDDNWGLEVLDELKAGMVVGRV